ncbi:MAG: hypothetical protein LUF04_05975 [Bacteroides sp.]|nr:hypothetical protein [Bacteroides sp.]
MSEKTSSPRRDKQPASRASSRSQGRKHSSGKRIGKSRPSKANNQLNRRVK